METKIAKIISYVFHPILMPSYALLFLLFFQYSFFSLTIPLNVKWLILTMVFITTVLFPLLSIFIMLRKGMLNSLKMESRQERIYPFITTAIFYYLTYYLLSRIQISYIFHVLILGSTLLIITALFINFFWKISIHMIAIGGVLGTFLGLSVLTILNIPQFIFFLIFISGIIGFSRLKLNAHNPAQVYAGFLTGTVMMFSLVYFM
ncbi:MAG: hypothetical protein JEY97_14670 [Bacteroidales bacterium]|nr:hypothetical protein [Bacteroidales bacterium]